MGSFKVGFLGPSGTNTEYALREYLASDQVEAVAYPSISDVFFALEAQSVDAGFVPIENIIQGSVTETLDSLLEYKSKVFIEDSHVMAIKHSLGVLQEAVTPGFNNSCIMKVVSHEQALRQCQQYLKREFPGAELYPVASTSAAVRLLTENNWLDAAVIAPLETINQYHLKVLAPDISDLPGNKTRFVLLRKGEFQDGNFVTGGKKLPLSSVGVEKKSANFVTSIIVNPARDRQRLLHEILDVISVKHQINLVSIHSRPDMKGGFVFHLVLEGHFQNPNIKQCLEDLQLFCADSTGETVEINNFGSYYSESFHKPAFRKVGIIGSKGKMGIWFTDFLQQNGFDVLGCDLDTALTIKDIAANAEVILLSVPMSAIKAVASELCPLLSPKQLLVENCSIKNCALPILTSLAPAEVEVLGIHTMFAGDATSIRNQNIVITKTLTSGVKAQAFEDLLYKHGARIIHSSIDEHDERVSFIQSLLQFNSLLMAEVMRNSFESPQSLDAFSTPNSRSIFKTIARILNQPEELIIDLQTMNDKASRMRLRYLQTAFHLVFQLENENINELKRLVENNKKYFKM